MRKPKSIELLKTLAAKLRAIRFSKNMSQTDVITLVYPEVDETQRSLISQWENAAREPGRQILIRYARLADISLEELLIDEIALPSHVTGAAGGYTGDIRKKRESEAVRAAVFTPLADTPFEQSGNGSSKTKVNLYLGMGIKRSTEKIQLDLREIAPPESAGQINYSLIVETALEIVFDEFDRVREASRLNREITKKLNTK